MQFNFNKPIRKLDGTAYNDEPNSEMSMNRVLATNLASQSKGDILKLFDWAQKLYNGELLEIDRSDTDKLKSIIENLDGVAILVKAQLLEILNQKD